MLHPLLRLKLPLFVFSLLSAVSVMAAADETRWYDVEVILFVQNSHSYRASEVWPLDYTLPDIENAQELKTVPEAARNPAKPIAFRQLDKNELQLNADAERIEKAADLELLKHFGWRQPGMPQDRAPAIKISIPAEPATQATDNAEKASAGALMTSAGELPPRLEGTLRLILSRYLHIEADLLYREPLDEQAVAEAQPVDSGAMPFGNDAAATEGTPKTPPAQQQDLFMIAEQASSIEQQPLYRVYRMQQSRRMRSGELHYLDHPVFGLAVRVTPYEPPKPASNPGQ